MKIIKPLSNDNTITTTIYFPTTYGNTRFLSMEQVKEELNSNADAKGLYAQCSIYGVECPRLGAGAFDMLFEAVAEHCSDAILCLGRIYEYGVSYLKKDIETARHLYCYAYDMHNIDALHSLGFLLFQQGDTEVGLAMIKQSAELGSKGARFHLNLIGDRINDVEDIDFYDIPKEKFEYDKSIAEKGITQYGVDLSDKRAIKDALIEVLMDIGMKTYADVMNEFRRRYLRNRSAEVFKDVNFRDIFNEMINDKEIESSEVKSYGVTEDTLYILRASGNIKTTYIEFDDLDLDD